MNLHFVQKKESWRKAPDAARAGFIKAMRDFQYGASETEDAWDWYLIGYFTAAGSDL